MNGRQWIGAAATWTMAALGLGVAAALSGCLSVPIPQAEADPARFYVLNPTTVPLAVASGGATAGGAGRGAAVGTGGATAEVKSDATADVSLIQLHPVEVASYLRSRPMIVRRGENEIQFREFARWGEPIELGVARVLREELLARGAAAHVVAGGGGGAANGPGAGRRHTLSVRVLACEGGADGSVFFRAVWELAPLSADAGAATRGDFRAANLRWDGKSEASLAAQLSAAVAGLAGEIAAAVKK